jgi:hypothetical protein
MTRRLGITALLTTGFALLLASLAVWSVSSGACDVDSNTCLGVPRVGRQTVAWQLVVAALALAAAGLAGLAVLLRRGRLSSAATMAALAAVIVISPVLAYWGYDRSNVYYEAGQPYRSGERPAALPIVLLLPAALAGAALAGTWRRPSHGG